MHCQCEIVYQNDECFAATVRKLRSIWGLNNAKNKSTVKKLMDTFAETSKSNVKITTRPRPCRSTKNISQIAVRDDVTQTPSSSIRLQIHCADSFDERFVSSCIQGPIDSGTEAR